MNRLARALSDAVSHVSAAGFDFAVVGGLAVSAWSEPRFTRDVDLAVAVQSDLEAESLVSRLIARGYDVIAQVEQEHTGRLATVRLVPTPQETTGLVVDLLFASSGIEPEIVRDAQNLELFSGLTVRVARVEHLLALKLLSRDDSRPQDQVDIVALLGVSTAEQLGECRRALMLIEERGYARDKHLLEEFEQLPSPAR